MIDEPILNYTTQKYKKYHQCVSIRPWVTAMPNPGKGPGRHYGRIDCLHCGKFIRWATKNEMTPGHTNELDPNGVELKHGWIYLHD